MFRRPCIVVAGRRVGGEKVFSLFWQSRLWAQFERAEMAMYLLMGAVGVAGAAYMAKIGLRGRRREGEKQKLPASLCF